MLGQRAQNKFINSLTIQSMAKNDFREVLRLIKAIFNLITELVPIAGDVIDIIDRIVAVVQDYKAEKALNDDYKA